MNKSTIPYPLLSLQTDLVFKAVFGRDTKESKTALIDLLNTILNRHNQDAIQSITHKNPFMLQEHMDAKESILDIKAETNTGELIDIEMQMNYTNLYRSRSLYYWARLHSEQLSKGESYSNAQKSICINLISEKGFPESERNHLRFSVLEQNEFFYLSHDLEIHYIQLPLFDDTIDVTLMDRMTEWMTLLKDIHLSDKQSIIKKIVSKKGVMQLAYDEYSKVTSDEILKEQLEARQKFKWDMEAAKDYAVEEGTREGIKQGLEKGLAQGAKKKALEIAKLLKEQNVSNDIIIASTGLSKEDVENL